MQFNVIFITTALLASASLVMSVTITGFAGAGCTGTKGETRFGVSSGECIILGGGLTKSINYSGVPSEIAFYISGGSHDLCTNTYLVLGGGSGCGTAPAG